MLHEVIGIVHLIFSILIGVYGVIFPKNVFDFWYILWHFIVNIHWTFLNGECFLTYYFKKMQNPNYKAGDDSTEMTDMSLVFNRNIIQLIVALGVAVTGISIFIVLSRNNYLPKSWIYVLVALFYIYTIWLRIPNKNLFYAFQAIYAVVLIIGLIMFLQRANR